MLCPCCGLTFPATDPHLLPDRCREATEAALAKIIPRMLASMADGLVRDGLPRSFASEAVGLRRYPTGC